MQIINKFASISDILREMETFMKEHKIPIDTGIKSEDAYIYFISVNKT